MAISTGAAILGGAALSLIGSSSAAGAAEDAAAAQAAATERANQQSLALQREIFERQQQNLIPQRIVGEGALYGLADMVGLSRPQDSLVQQQLQMQYGQQPQQQMSQGAVNAFGGQIPIGSLFGPNQQGGYNLMGLPINPSPNSVFSRRMAQMQQGGGQQQQGAPSPYANIGMTQGVSGGLAASPDYQFRLNEGLGQVQSSAAARGLLRSGRTLRDLLGFQQGLASQEYGNRFNRLATLAGYGNAATQQQNQLGSVYGANVGNQIAQTGANIGAIRGSGIAAAGNAWGQGLSGVGNALGFLGGYGQSAPPPPQSQIAYYPQNLVR